MTTRPDDTAGADNWDAIGFIVRSRYRQTVVDRLDESPAQPSTIADESGVDIAQVSRALGELRDRNLVELLVSEETRKGRVYGLTDRGADTWHQAVDAGVTDA